MALIQSGYQLRLGLLIRLSTAISNYKDLMQIRSIFDEVKTKPLDPITEAWITCINDPTPDKVDLTLGEYRDDDNKPYVMQVVKKAEQKFFQNNSRHIYGRGEGQLKFQQFSRRLIFSPDSIPEKQSLIKSHQVVAGSGAFSAAVLFMKKQLNIQTLHVSTPGYSIHVFQGEQLGIKLKYYNYFDQETKKLNLKAILQYFNSLQKGSVVVLQTNCHNPTGVDPNQDEWRQMGQIFKQKQLIPFFDTPYQGFSSGDFYEDAYPIRVFYELGVVQMLIAQSFSKNMGLYGQRVGVLHVTASTRQAVQKAFQGISNVCHSIYVSPPTFGAMVACEVLKDPQIEKQWKREFKEVVWKRLVEARKLLRDELQKVKAPGDWSFLTEQKGFMSLLGLTAEQCRQLAKNHHVHIMRNSRICLPGVNTKNVTKIADSISKVISKQQ